MRGIQSWQGTLFYHMSKQRFFELPGLENPSLKLPATDTMASPWLIDWVVFMVSTAMDIVIIGNKAEEKRSMGMPFSDNPMILFFFLEVHCYFNGYWDVRNDLWEQKWRFGISVPEINLFFFLFRRGEMLGLLSLHVQQMDGTNHWLLAATIVEGELELVATIVDKRTSEAAPWMPIKEAWF